LIHANGVNITILTPRTYIKEFEDKERASAIDPLPFNPDVIMIEMSLSIPNSRSDANNTQDAFGYGMGCNVTGDEHGRSKEDSDGLSDEEDLPY
jgi:hypothetical protein